MLSRERRPNNNKTHESGHEARKHFNKITLSYQVVLLLLIFALSSCLIGYSYYHIAVDQINPIQPSPLWHHIFWSTYRLIGALILLCLIMITALIFRIEIRPRAESKHQRSKSRGEDVPK